VAGDPALARLRWRCRRGMRELDVRFERFMAGGTPASGAERAAFERLLDLPDPLLAQWLIFGAPPPDDLEAIVEHIRARARTASA
jgi:antitoxin CptB